MSQVLYRKHRSQTFDELRGQDHVVSILKNAVSQGQTSHAYLFHGPRGLGKTSTARILAKAVNCLQLCDDGNPCNKCSVCKAITAGNFLDLIEIDAASNRGIEEIRELKEKIEFSPTEGKYKVYIIDEVHMLTTEAFNALLKTLEEPPAHAIFILATTEIHKVPATILSRCQRFDFRLATDNELRSHMEDILKKEGVEMDEEAMDLVVENARGSYRDGLSLLDVVVSGQENSKDPEKVTEEEVRAILGLADSTMVYVFLESLVNGESSKALQLLTEMAQKGVNLSQFVKFVLSVLREILVGEVKGDVSELEYSFAEKLDRKKTLRLLNLFVEAERSLKDAVIPTLPLEVLVADSMDIFESSDIEENVAGDENSNNSGGSEGTSSNRKKPIGDSKNAKKKNSDGENRKKTTGKKQKAESKIQKQEEKSSDVESDPDTAGADKNSGNSSGLTVEKKKLLKKWGEVMKELEPYNSHLYMFVGRSKVVSLRDSVLKLAVGFEFHKDRMESPKSREAISKVFEKVFGAPIKLKCIVDDSVRQSVKPVSDVVVVEEDTSEPTGGQSSKQSDGPGEKNIYDNIAEVFGSDLVEG